MPTTKLPARPSLEFLRKLAKDRLEVLRGTDSRAQLADALLAVAREHGFPSWRALKAEVDARSASAIDALVAACRSGDLDAARRLLDDDPALVHARDTPHHAQALYFAVCNLDLARLLLDRGADPNDAGDYDGIGPLGWATIHSQPKFPTDVIALLLERGGRHHIFSAIALGDVALMRQLVEQMPDALDRRLSGRYHGQNALHFAIEQNRSDLLGALIELGADLDVPDDNGQTPLEFATMHGNRAATELLTAAGAKPPRPAARGAAADPTTLASSVQKGMLVFGARDVAATLDWYTAVGFTEVQRYPEEGPVTFWGLVTLGKAELTFDVRVPEPLGGATLLLITNGIRGLYDHLRSLQVNVVFVESLHEEHGQGLQFSIRDPNGYTLCFLQPKT